MTTPSSLEELRSNLINKINELDWTQAEFGYIPTDKEIIDALIPVFRSHMEAVIDPFDFVEPCEPECSPERHAYHQGQWDMAGRIKSYLEGEKTNHE